MWFLRLLADIKVSGDKLSNDTLPTLSATEIVTNILNTANGEPSKAKKAMDTIIFSVVGLIIVIAAFAITKFVVDNVGK